MFGLSFAASFVVSFVQAMVEQPIVALNRRGAGIVRLHHGKGSSWLLPSTVADLSLVYTALIVLAVLLLDYYEPGTLVGLAMAVPAKVVVPDMIYEGTKIMLPSQPKPMDLDEAIRQLTLRKQDEETQISMSETFDVYPFDGARAFMLAVKEVYGHAAASKNFFGERTSSMINIKVDHDKTESILWGKFELPNVPGQLSTAADWTPQGYRFCLKAVILKKHAHLIKQLAERTRELLNTESIYRGAATRFQWDHDKNMPKTPEYIDLTRVNPDELVFNSEVLEQVQTTIFTPLLKADWCKALGIPFKRGVCLIGHYGTGKTQAAYVAATYAKQNGISVVLVEEAEQLSDAMQFARTYSPALVICEDIDRVTAERDNTCNEIMDALDGVEAKGTDVMVLFTSNNPDSIHPAMRRAGRIDTFIKVNPPDAVAVEKLLLMYGRGQIDKYADLTTVCELLAGQIPALIREVVERARLASVSRAVDLSDAFKVTAEDLEISARRLKMQQDLFRERNMDAVRELEQVASFGARLTANISAVASNAAKQLAN